LVSIEPTKPKKPEFKLPIDNPQSISLGDKLENGYLDDLLDSKIAKELELKKQFELLLKGGDVANQLGLVDKLKKKGGWGNGPKGMLSPMFHKHCFLFPHAHCFPHYYPHHCFCHNWCPWMSFCHHFHWGHCHWQPHIWCHPPHFHPCPIWTCWTHYPIFYPLPHYPCGTWINVQPVNIVSGLDLQCLAIRYVDAGHPSQKLGPRYRMWVRNNSKQVIAKPFNVLMMAGDTAKPSAEYPYAGNKIEMIKAGETKIVDIRLPVLSKNQTKLHVLVDSHKDIAEANEENNGTVLDLSAVTPVDPVLFGSDEQSAQAGELLTIAGEGLGPMPGRVIVHAAGMEWEAEIEGWNDLGVRVKLPNLPLADVTPAEMIVVRGDGAAANPLSINLKPQS